VDGVAILNRQRGAYLFERLIDEYVARIGQIPRHDSHGAVDLNGGDHNEGHDQQEQ
jgi:hypothetical protein